MFMFLKTKVRRILSVILSDKMYIKIQYRSITGRKLNLNNPVRYNEKLQWLKLYDHKPEYTDYVDKIKVKSIISKSIGEKYIIPTIGVWDNVDDIDFDKLPDQFVIKCNHDSHSVCICKNKLEFDIQKTKEKLSKALKRNMFYYGREWPYKNISPQILAEKYMEDESGGLQDYKVLCFDGIPKLIQLHSGRFTDGYTQDFYDVDWNLQPFNQRGEQNSKIPQNKPVFLEEMLELSAKLSKNIPHVRVDWYYANDQLYFGELTFFDAAGYDEFVPDEYNNIIGDWIKLPMININQY